MESTSTDRIQKQILLNAPRARVWHALTDSREFGAWFQAVFTEPFTKGSIVSARITHPGYEHIRMKFVIDRIEPEQRFSYRWHPHAIDMDQDYSKEPMTLVEFTLAVQDGGTLLTVTESGFDRIPIARRADALKGNDEGWAGQMKAVESYLTKSS